MKPHQPTIDKLIREVEAARLEEAVLAATGEDLLDRAQEVAEAVEERVRQVSGWTDMPAPGNRI
jgi:hypothetical protein